jgi:endonuclease/exonuclease/phosphatase family metal-dependent hydrolase
MMWVRNGLVVGFLGISGLGMMLNGCGSDDPANPPGNGGGIVPQGGSSGSAGAGGSSGSAGMAGSTSGSAGAGMSGASGSTATGTPYVFETYNVGLAGRFVPNESVRRQPFYDAMAAKDDADVVCLQELWLKSDKDAVALAAMAKYPHKAMVVNDDKTPLDDATDAKGMVPAAPSGPPCGDEPISAAMNAPKASEALAAGLACLQEKCNTNTPGDPMGMMTNPGCAQSKCLTENVALLTGNAAAKRCYGCFASNTPIRTFSDLQSECSTNDNGGLGFYGDNGLLILSKHPIAEQEAYVVPGTWNRRIILRAKVNLPNGTNVDVYCNHLTASFTGLIYPYTGQYGADGPSSNLWENEQYLQTQKLISWVETKTGTGKAVILGDFNTGLEYKDAPAGPIKAEAQATYDLLKKTYALGEAANFTPECTYCNSNPNVTDTPTNDGIWIDHIFLKGLEQSAVTESKVTFKEANTDGMTTMGTPVKVPLSDHFGFRSTIHIAP